MTETLKPVEEGLEAAAEVSRLTDGPNKCVLEYYTMSPVSADGSKLVYFTYDRPVPDRLRDGGKHGWVMVANADGTNPQAITPMIEGHGSMAQGAGQQWCGPMQRVAYKIDVNETTRWHVMDLETGDRWEGEGMLREVSPDGRALFLQTGEFIHLEAEQRGQTLGPEDVAARIIDYERGAEERRITLADVLAAHPEAEALEHEHLCFKQTTFSPNGDHIAFVISNVNYRRQTSQPVNEARRHEICIADRDGGNIRCLGPFATHPSWHPSGDAYCALIREETGDYAYAIFPTDGSAPTYWRHSILRGGHPSIQPSPHQYLINDQYKADEQMVELWMFDLTDWSAHLLIRAYCDDYSNDRGTHLHPTWSADGRSIHFNSAHSGVGHLYRLDLPPTF